MNAATGEAIEDSQDVKECDANGCNRRSVMRQLRNLGYNAALCKSRWNNGGTFPGGDLALPFRIVFVLIIPLIKTDP